MAVRLSTQKGYLKLLKGHYQTDSSKFIPRLERFQRQLYPEMAVRHTAKRGWGLYLEQDVKKGDFVVEYVGELITTQEYRFATKESAVFFNIIEIQIPKEFDF
jgi:hypothetical protein